MLTRVTSTLVPDTSKRLPRKVRLPDQGADGQVPPQGPPLEARAHAAGVEPDLAGAGPVRSRGAEMGAHPARAAGQLQARAGGR